MHNANMRLSSAAIVLSVATCLAAGPAQAGLLPSSLSDVGITLPANAQLPLQASGRDETGKQVTLGEALGGRPALFMFADYTCKTLCGPALSFAADALLKSGLSAKQYRLVVLSLDPKDSTADAAEMRRQQAPEAGLPLVMLTADGATINAAAAAVGYRYHYDAEHDQYAHPAAVLVTDATGHVIRALSALGIDANDFKLALTEAGRGSVGSFTDQVHLLCYGFDPSVGVYTLSIQRALAVSGAITIVLLVAGIGWLAWRSRSSLAG
jgi:protein SCO1/2